MKHIILIVALLALPATAQDSWTGHDKQLHFLVSAGFGVASGAYFERRRKAFAVAMIPGLAKELIDSQSAGNQFSGKDLVWDAIGAGLGVQIGAWGRKKHRGTIARSWTQLQHGMSAPALWAIRVKRDGLMLTWRMWVDL